MAKQLVIRYAADGSKVKQTLNEMEAHHGKFGAAVGKMSGGVRGAVASMTSSFTSNFGAASGVVGTLTNSLTGMGGTAGLIFGGMVVAAAGVLSVLKKLADTTTDYAFQVRELRDITGASAEESSRLLAVMDDLEISLEGGGRALIKFSRGVDEGSESLRKWFSDAEIGKMRGADLIENIGVLRERFQSLHSPIQQNAFLMDVFGKSGFTMRRMMEQSEGNFRRMADQAERLGLIMSDKDIRAAEEYRFALDDLGDALKGMAIEIGRGVVPALTKFINFLVETIVWLRTAEEWLSKLGDGHSKAWQEAAKHTESNKKLKEEVKANAEGFERLDKAVTDAAKNLIAEWDKASAELNKVLDSLVPKFGDAFQEAGVKSADALKDALAKNSKQLHGWVDGLGALGVRIEAIADKDIAQAFLARIAEMGPGALPLLESLNKTTDAKLAELAGIFAGQINAAKQAADLEFDKYPPNWSSKIGLANQAVFEKLEELAAQFLTLPDKTSPMALALAGQIETVIGKLVALEQSGVDVMDPYLEELALTILKEEDVAKKAEAIGKFIDGLHGKRATVSIDLEWGPVGPLGPVGPGKNALSPLEKRAVELIGPIFFGRSLREKGETLAHPFSGRPESRHAGGLVGSGSEILAVLEQGEYVIRRRAAELLGTGFLDRLNRIHLGGPVAPFISERVLERATSTTASITFASGAIQISAPGGDPGQIKEAVEQGVAEALARALKAR